LTCEVQDSESHPIDNASVIIIINKETESSPIKYNDVGDIVARKEDGLQ